MDRELDVWLDDAGSTIRVGRLWARSRGRKESASFEYDPTWLERKHAFPLDPELPLARGSQHTGRPLFNAFTDPAPDRWGQMLMRRYERARARSDGRAPRTLLAVDFLALVDDEARLGALRFTDAGRDGLFLSSSGQRIPPLLELPRLLSATTRILDDQEDDDDLQLVLAPGTSLGGARPKASVRDQDGHLLIAKFPKKDDEWPVTRWEAATLALAESAGIEVSPWRLELVLRRPVLMLRRFDRRGTLRVPFQSALTALAAAEHETHGYVEIAEALRREGARVTSDLRQLWRRLAFNILVSNTDDHLRNHGFLREPKGWRLAPAYDLNPTPVDVRPRAHALSIGENDAAEGLEAAFAAAAAFGLGAGEAKKITAEVGRAVARWRVEAARFGIKPREIERMESAFEHEDRRRAQG